MLSVDFFHNLFHSFHYISQQSLIQNGRSLRTPEIWQETHIRRTVIITITDSLIPLQYEIQLINLDLGEGEPLQPNQSLDIPLLVM